MPRQWYGTDLSVSPPSYQIGSEDTEAFAFDAEQAVTAASAKLTRLDTFAVIGEVTAGVSESIAELDVSLSSPTATVTVTGLTRNVNYELAVTFTNSAGREWTRTLVLECVA